MRRSFGLGMGGGGGGGRGMIKNVEGAMRGGIGGGASSEPPPFSTTRTTTSNNNHQPINNALSLSSNNTLINHPLPAAVSSPPLYSGEESCDDWECIYDEDTSVCHDDFGFGSVPSKDEVHHAFSSLQQVVDVSFSHEYGYGYGYGINNKEKVLSTPNKHQLDWMEPSLELCSNSSSVISTHHLIPTCSRVYDAFHLMQTDPSVQRMVISLSSDKAVWDAVMNNEVVRELGESIGEEDKLSIWEDDDGGCNPVKQVLRWMFVNTKDKVVEIVERITKIVNDLVQPQPNNNKEEEEKPKREGSGSAADSFQEKLRSSFFLSIMVLFVVVVTRAGTRNAS